MRYEITQEMVSAMKDSIGIVPGACTEICHKHGISTVILSRILNGRRDGVEEGTWLRLCQAFPLLRQMAKPRVGAGATIPLKGTEEASQSKLDAFRLRLTDAVLKEPRLDDRSKMLVLQLVAEAAHGS